MQQFFHNVGTFIVGAAIAVAGWFGYTPTENLGATIPKVVALFETSLASKITKTDSSITLVSGTDQAGGSLSGYIGFIIDEGTATQEFVGCNASGTALTGCIRGINPVTGNTTSSALAFEHRRGASVKITNFPVLGVITRQLNGDETFLNPLKYDITVATSTIGADGANIASVGYVQGVAFAGAPDGSETAKGLFEAATASELSSGSATGTTGALLAAQAKHFNSTSSATTTVPVTKTNGKLSQGFLDLSEPFTFTATSTFSGSASFASLPTIPTSTPTTSTQAVSYGYVASRFPAFYTSTSGQAISWGALNATSSIASISVNPTYSGRFLITANTSLINVQSQGSEANTCSVHLWNSTATSSAISAHLQFGAFSSGGNNNGGQSLGFSYITPILTANTTTTYNMYSLPGGNAARCSGGSLTNLQVQYLGN